jgi:hypothetical protein
MPHRLRTFRSASPEGRTGMGPPKRHRSMSLSRRLDLRFRMRSRRCSPREIRLYGPFHEAFPRCTMVREHQGFLKRGQ